MIKHDQNNPNIITPSPQVVQHLHPPKPPPPKKKNILLSPQTQRTRGPARVTWRKTMPLGEDWVAYYLQSLSGFKEIWFQLSGFHADLHNLHGFPPF